MDAGDDDNAAAASISRIAGRGPIGAKTTKFKAHESEFPQRKRKSDCTILEGQWMQQFVKRESTQSEMLWEKLSFIIWLGVDLVLVIRD